MIPDPIYPPYINKPLPTSIAIPKSLPSPAATKLSSYQVPMAGREIVPYIVDLNKKPDALALSVVPVDIEIWFEMGGP